LLYYRTYIHSAHQREDIVSFPSAVSVSADDKVYLDSSSDHCFARIHDSTVVGYYGPPASELYFPRGPL